MDRSRFGATSRSQAGSDPGPRATGIDEDLDVGHVCRVPGALAQFGRTTPDLYARPSMTHGRWRQIGSMT